MKIAVLGTRGIPNRYGGFEQFAEQFSGRMAERGHSVYVYSAHNHPHTGNRLGKVELIKCFDPEYRIGTAGQFLYDLNCIRDSRKRGFDIILQLGYTSSTIWSWLLPKNTLVVTNMDGLEWKRTKYNRLTKWFLTHAERWAVNYSDHLIADSEGIKQYLLRKYKVEAELIAYGADVYRPDTESPGILVRLGLEPMQYDLLVARFEPENNIEIALDAYAASGTRLLVLVGNYAATQFGTQCYKKYGELKNIRFAGAVYDGRRLNELRYQSRLYIHGHSVGGTNPSLLEAMGCQALIAAHDNVFNRSVLGDDAFYYSDRAGLLGIINSDRDKKLYEEWIQRNADKIRDCYNWEKITDNIENKFRQWIAFSK